jgi:hypothetical protein
MLLIKREFSKVGEAFPSWHRKEPNISVLNIDPGFEQLRLAFPNSWEHLLRAKSMLDHAAIDEVITLPSGERCGLPTAELASRVAIELAAVAGAEHDTRAVAIAAAEECSRAFTAYAETGRWPGHVVHPPRPGQPWLYCGPLEATWETRPSAPISLNLLVANPDQQEQSTVRGVDNGREAFRSQARDVLAGEPELPVPPPAMFAMTLLLLGGSMSFGHKSFAHFLPVESPGGRVTEEDFTIVFTNILLSRIDRCSLRLLRDSVGGVSGDISAESVASASLAWFRCHDVGHFWRASGFSPESVTQASKLTKFERTALKETYADTIGLLNAQRCTPAQELSVAFNAELLRYLSCDWHRFADTVSATIELGWLARDGITLPSADSGWLDKSYDSLARLARTVHAVLWETGDSGLDVLHDAFVYGREMAGRFEETACLYPTDLSYTFG